MILGKYVRNSLLVVAAVSCTALFAALVPSASYAYNSDAALERDGALCTRQVTRSERKYGIPQRLLGAMAATETGRRHKGLGIQVPWPWTINVEGKPYFYDTKTQAVAAVEQFQSLGATSIDVGCMQINLRHHPNAFATLNQAFEPSSNIDYAARFLRGHYDETRSWKEAVGRYHSRTPAHASRYIATVYDKWYGLASKVAETRGINTGRSRYKSYIRMEGSGQEAQFNRYSRTSLRKVPAPPASRNVHVVKAISRTAKQPMELNIIRPAHSAGKIATAPTQNSDSISGPLVMNLDGAKRFTNSKVMAISAEGKTSGEQDNRFIRFVD